MGPRSRGVPLQGARGRAAERSPLHLHHLVHRRHILVEVIHDPERAGDHQRDDQDAERQRQHVVGVVRSRVDVQEENQMHAHLRDSEHNQRNRDARTPDQGRVEHVERRRGQHAREHKSNDIARDPLVNRNFRRVHESGSHVARVSSIGLVTHRPNPIRYTTVNSATQMMSSACQNKLKHTRRRRISARKPLTKTCAIIVPSQRSPALTCSPCRPTTANKDDRKALRSGPAPCITMLAKSRPSSTRNASPNNPVTSSATCVHSWFRTSVATADSPQVKLEMSKNAVCATMLHQLNSSRPEGPPAVAVCSTACAAKKAENITMSLSRKIQKP